MNPSSKTVALLIYNLRLRKQDNKQQQQEHQIHTHTHGKLDSTHPICRGALRQDFSSCVGQCFGSGCKSTGGSVGVVRSLSLDEQAHKGQDIGVGQLAVRLKARCKGVKQVCVCVWRVI